MNRRPVGVTVLAVVAIVYGVLMLLGGLSLIGISAFAIPGVDLAGVFQGIGIAAGIASLIAAALFVVFGVGALGLRSWAWTLGVVLLGLMLLVNIAGMFTGVFTVALAVMAVLYAVALVYLLTDDVRSVFGHHRGVMRHTGTPVAH